MLKFASILAFAALPMGMAHAASGDAWAEFATEVEQNCIEASTDFFTDATAVVDPFGSESYGLAIVSGETPAGTTASLICVFDKQAKTVEIGGELNVAVTPVEPTE